MTMGSAGNAAAAVPAGPLAHARHLCLLLARSFLAQSILFIIPILYLISNQAMFRSVGHVPRASVLALLTELLTFSVPVAFVSILLLRVVQYMFILKPERPLLLLWHEIRSFVLRPHRLIMGIPVFAAMLMFNKALVELKPEIPKVNPFSWDQTFMQFDRALHFGVDPWRILQPVLGYDLITFLFNLAYNFWFLFLIGAWFWYGFRAVSDELRTRFFVSYMLTWWVGGALLAVAFSSAGPAYYGLIGLSPDPYAPLMAYLRDVDTRLPLWMLDAQKLLWDGYAGKTQAFGISAFPSMHNASAMIFALTFFQTSRKLGYWMFAYAAVILLGSIHSGWHYAVDGYAGLAIAYACWLIAGPIARWHATRPSTKRLNEELSAL
jgi:PAP2 superfamily